MVDKSNYGSDYGGRTAIDKSMHNAKKHNNPQCCKAYAKASSESSKYGF